jgi:hypothetical protein
MVVRVSETAQTTLWANFYRGCGLDTDAPHGTEIKPLICKNMDNKSVYNESHLYNDEWYADTLCKVQ